MTTTLQYTTTETHRGGSPHLTGSRRSSSSEGAIPSARRARTVAWGRPRITQDRAAAARASQGAWAMASSPVFVGIDVAQAELVLAVRPTAEAWTVGND